MGHASVFVSLRLRSLAGVFSTESLNLLAKFFNVFLGGGFLFLSDLHLKELFLYLVEISKLVYRFVQGTEVLS